RQMLAKTGQRPLDPIESSQVADRAEQAGHGVVSIGKSELAHICLEEAACWVLLPRDAQERRIEVQAVDVEADVAQQPRVFARAARRVEDRAAGGMQP